MKTTYMHGLTVRTDLYLLVPEEEPPVEEPMYEPTRKDLWVLLAMMLGAAAITLFAIYGFYEALVKFGHLLEGLIR